MNRSGKAHKSQKIALTKQNSDIEDDLDEEYQDISLDGSFHNHADCVVQSARSPLLVLPTSPPPLLVEVLIPPPRCG